MRPRKHSRTLTGSRIYIRWGFYQYFSREPLLNPKTCKIAKWHKLCPLSEGELKARNILNELLGITDQPKGRGDICAWFATWRKEILLEREAKVPRDPMRNEIWSKGTKALVNVLNVVETAFSDFDVAQVAPCDVAVFLDQWKGRRAAQLYKGHLFKFFAWCCRRGLLRENPAREVELFTPKKRKVYMTDEVYNKIMCALLKEEDDRKPTHNDVMVACLMDMYYLIYQRGTDVRLLRSTQLNGKEITFVPTKTENTSEAAVRITITEEIRSVVARAKAVAKLRSIYLFHNEYGQPMNSRLARDTFKRACERAKLHGYILKDVRSKAASDAKKMGYTEDQIKVAFAHTNTDTTRDYIREQEAPLSEVVLKLPKRDF